MASEGCTAPIHRASFIRYTLLLHFFVAYKEIINMNICSVLFQQSRLQQLIIDRCDRYICGLSIFSITVYNIGFSRTAVYNTYLHRLVEKSDSNRTCVLYHTMVESSTSETVYTLYECNTVNIICIHKQDKFKRVNVYRRSHSTDPWYFLSNR